MQIYYEDDQACLFDPESFHGKTCPEPSPPASRPAKDFRIVLEKIIKICVPDIYIPRPHAGKFQSAGWIRVGDTLSVGWRVLDAQLCSAEHN